MNKIRKGDEVIVLAGKDKGKRGRVSLRKDDQYLVVDGVNLVKKHTKPNPMKGTTGGIVEKAMPIPSPATDQPTTTMPIQVPASMLSTESPMPTVSIAAPSPTRSTLWARNRRFAASQDPANQATADAVSNRPACTGLKPRCCTRASGR